MGFVTRPMSVGTEKAVLILRTHSCQVTTVRTYTAQTGRFRFALEASHLSDGMPNSDTERNMRVTIINTNLGCSNEGAVVAM